MIFNIPGGARFLHPFKRFFKESMSHSKSSRSSYQAEDLHHKEPQKHKWIAATWRFEKGDIQKHPKNSENTLPRGFSTLAGNDFDRKSAFESLVVLEYVDMAEFIAMRF